MFALKKGLRTDRKKRKKRSWKKKISSLHFQQSSIRHIIMSLSNSTASSTSSSPSNVHQVTNNFTENSFCDAERVWVEESNRWTVLFARCIGLEETLDDGTTKPLLDFNEDPFKLLKKKDIKPSLECLRDEVRRRSGLTKMMRMKTLPTMPEKSHLNGGARKGEEEHSILRILSWEPILHIYSIFGRFG